MKRCVLKQIVISSVLLFAINDSYAFSWHELWLTPDQKAAQLMQQSEFAAARGLFVNKFWQATAAFRAKEYQQAANDFEQWHSDDGYYNQANALAYLQQYEQAIKAYDKALAINPDNRDAKYNRDVVASLLKQQQQKENKQQQNKSDKSDKDSQKNDTKQDKAPQNQQPDKPSSADKKSAKQTDTKEQDKADSQSQPATAKKAADAKEQERAKEQWLRLIPDDPGGLLREKFLRDYIRRQRGWN